MSGIKLKSLLVWLIKGKSITRSFLNSRLENEPELKGLTLDLGGGGEPSYKSVLKISGQFVNMDAIAEANPTVVGNIEERLPFNDNYADTVILFNTLEHVYDHQHVVNEMWRVSKIGGKSLVYTPFIFPVHTHQTENFLIDDYFRYSESALNKMFSKAGFSKVSIEPMGGGFLVVAEVLSMLVSFRILKLPVTIFCLGLESIYRKLKPNISQKRYPLAYFVVAEK